MALETELETFRRELPVLLADANSRGKFVLIHKQAVARIWPTADQALKAGYEQFGLEPFLVKEVTEHEKPRYFSHNLSRCR